MNTGQGGSNIARNGTAAAKHGRTERPWPGASTQMWWPSSAKDPRRTRHHALGEVLGFEHSKFEFELLIRGTINMKAEALSRNKL